MSIFDEALESGGYISDSGGYFGADGQLNAYRSRWTPGSFTGRVAPNQEVGGTGDSRAGELPDSNMLPADFWARLGFTGQAYMTDGIGEQQVGVTRATPELIAWTKANGIEPGFTEGYGGVLQNGQIVPGSAFGNRSNDDATFIAGALGLGAFGGLAAAGGGATTGGLQGAIAQGALTGGAAGGSIGALGTAGQLGAGLGAFGGAAAAGNNSGYQLDPNSFGGANYTGAQPTGGTGDFLSKLSTGVGNLSAKDYINIISGIYGMKLSSDARKASDPFAGYRAGYGEKLAALEANPSLITRQPGWQAGLDLIDRQMGSRGYLGSGNNKAVLSRYAGDFYGQEMQRLAGLAGANVTPGNGQFSSAQLAGQSLASIGYGLAPGFRSSGTAGAGNVNPVYGSAVQYPLGGGQ